MITIGIDIGTTSICAAVMDTEKQQVITSRTLPGGSFLPGAPWERMQDPQEIIERACGLLEELLTAYPEIAAIGLTGQMHGITYIDKEGKSISPLYTWQDGRGNLPRSRAAAESGVPLHTYIRETYHIPAASGYGLVTHIYNQEAGLVPTEAVTIATIMDYLGMVLTGRKRPLMHASNAASLGFFDEEHLCFYTEILEACGVSTDFLPEVIAFMEPIGDFRGLPVYTALGDNQASFLGAVGMDRNTWQINVGTGGQISVLSDRIFTASGIEARPYLNGTWILTGSILCAGRAYAILEHFFRAYAAACGAPEEEQYSIMAKLAAESETSTPPLCISTKFAGTRIDPNVRGSITGISEDNFTPGSMIHGVLQGIVNEFLEIGHPIMEGTGMKVDKIIGSGNGLRKNALLQHYCEQTFHAPLTMSIFVEEAASGAALSPLYRTK